MPSPETDIVAAYAAGQAAYRGAQPINTNPFASDATSDGGRKFAAWNLGFNAAASDDQRVPNAQVILDNLFTIQRILSVAEILALFTTPLDLLPDNGSFLVRPSRIAFAKEAGTAYTLNSATRLILQWKNASSFTECGGAAMAGFADQAAAGIAGFLNGPGAAPGPYSNFAPALMAGILGKGIRITNDVANLTVGTGRILVRVAYELIPNAFWSF